MPVLILSVSFRQTNYVKTAPVCQSGASDTKEKKTRRKRIRNRKEVPTMRRSGERRGGDTSA